MSCDKWRVAAVALIVATLLGCRGDAVESLLVDLRAADPAARRASALALAGAPGDDPRIAAALRETVHDDEDAEVRRTSLETLGKRTPADESTLSTVAAALEDADPSVRLAAAFALQRLAPDDQRSIPVLTAAMREGDGRVLLAVGEMGAQAKWAVPALTVLLNHDAPQLRALAAQTLGRIGPAAAAAKPALTRRLNDPHPAVQTAAKIALARIE